jgi:hypothetical protein
MWPQLCGLTFLVTLATWISGCALVQPAESKVQPEPARQMSMDELREIESFFVTGETSAINPKQLNVGQHVQIMISGGSDNEFPNSVAAPTKVAGTVKEVNADHVVLQDLLMVKESRLKPSSSFTTKIPYVSRWGRNSGVGRVSTAVPGELTIEMSSILHVGEVADVEFDAMQKNAQSQRIGVDYDFDIPDAQLADKPVMKKQVQ